MKNVINHSKMKFEVTSGNLSGRLIVPLSVDETKLFGKIAWIETALLVPSGDAGLRFLTQTRWKTSAKSFEIMPLYRIHLRKQLD